MNTPEPIQTFDDTLNLSLQALLQEREPLDTCLEKYPQYAEELKPLLQTALLTQRLKKPIMSDERVAALQERLMQAFPAAPVPENEATPLPLPVPVRRPVMIFPAWMGRTAAIVALVLLATFGAGGGTVAASANSVPGETLYGVKRAWEDFILFFASLIGRMNDMQLHLAYVRWQELQTLSQRGQLVPEAAWQSFAQTFKAAYQEADAKAQSDLRQVLADVEAAVNQAMLPATYRADLIAIVNQPADGVTTLLTPESTTLATQEILAMGTSTQAPVNTVVPTDTLLVVSTPTLLAVTPATATRTPTPSRTPTATHTPSGTPTPLTPLPSPTATYTRLPLSIPSQVNVLPTQPGSDPIPVTVGADGPLLTPDNNGGEDPIVPIVGTFDPIIRPTMRAVYATQTALASVSEEEIIPGQP